MSARFRARTAGRAGSDAATEFADGPGTAGRTPWRLAHFCVVDLSLIHI